MKLKYKGFELDVTHSAVKKMRIKNEPFNPNKRNKINKKQRYRVKKRDNFMCKQCGSKQDLTVDHIIPLSQGGPDRENNMQTLCLLCNQRKGSNIITEHIKI